MRYEGQIYRPPSEADSYILQATIGCSWNHCTYCDMYRSKPFRVRALEEILSDLQAARLAFGGDVEKVFVADGDALVMDLEQAKQSLNNLDPRFHIGRLQRDIGESIDLNPRRDLHDGARLVGNREVSLGHRCQVRRHLKLQGIKKDVRA